MKCTSICPHMVIQDDELDCQGEEGHITKCFHKNDFWIVFWEKDGMALRGQNSTDRMVGAGIFLPGWFCKNPRCGVFNGEEKEIRKECRCCGSAK